MYFVENEFTTRRLKAPPDWDEEKNGKCDTLPITDAVHNGLPCVMSFWKPTAEELAHLNANGQLMLQIVGKSMPPVIVGVIELHPL